MICCSNTALKDQGIQVEYYYEGSDETFESRCYEIEKTYLLDVWVLEQIADLTAGRPGRHSSAWGSHLVLVTDDSTVMLQWSVGGYFWSCGCLSWCLGHCTTLRRSGEHTGGGDRPRAGPKLTGSMVWTRVHTHTHTHTHRHGRMHLNRYTYIHKQTDTHLPPSQHLIWVMAISGKNTALGHTSPPALPPFCSPPASPAPSFPLAFVTTPLLSLSLLRQHYTSHQFRPVFNLDNFPELPTLFSSLCASFYTPSHLAILH